MTEISNASTKGADAKKNATKQKKQRRITGNLPYANSPGAFKTVLEKLIKTERPERVTQDFVSDVLQVKGGSGKAAIPILKRTGFLSGDGVPTEIYAKFKTDSGRSLAALTALKTGYAEIFRRREFAHKLPDAELQDVVVEITGLKDNDQIVRYICSTFQAIRSFIDTKTALVDEGMTTSAIDESNERTRDGGAAREPLTLSYQINIVLPPTTNVEVFNAIFKSLRDNLLR